MIGFDWSVLGLISLITVCLCGLFLDESIRENGSFMSSLDAFLIEAAGEETTSIFSPRQKLKFALFGPLIKAGW